MRFKKKNLVCAFYVFDFVNNMQFNTNCPYSPSKQRYTSEKGIVFHNKDQGDKILHMYREKYSCFCYTTPFIEKLQLPWKANLIHQFSPVIVSFSLREVCLELRDGRTKPSLQSMSIVLRGISASSAHPIFLPVFFYLILYFESFGDWYLCYTKLYHTEQRTRIEPATLGYLSVMVNHYTSPSSDISLAANL